MTAPQWATLLKQTFIGWIEDRAPRLGAALAYYTVLALAPVVILLTPLAAAVFGHSAKDAIVAQFAELVGQVGADAVRTVLAAPARHDRVGHLTTLFSLVVLLFAASGVFAELQDALDTIWEVKPKPGRAAVWSFIRKRFLSFAMVLGICFLLLMSLLISAGLAALRNVADQQMQSAAFVWGIIHAIVAWAVVTLLFAMIYKVLPDVEIGWRDVWTGAAITALLFAAGKFAIGTYLGRASVGAYYGAAGSLVALLAWVYYSSQILYLGAEFTKVYSKRHGPPPAPTEDAVPITAEAQAQQGIARQEVVEAVKEVVERRAGSTP